MDSLLNKHRIKFAIGATVLTVCLLLSFSTTFYASALNRDITKVNKGHIITAENEHHINNTDFAHTSNGIDNHTVVKEHDNLSKDPDDDFKKLDDDEDPNRTIDGSRGNDEDRKEHNDTDVNSELRDSGREKLAYVTFLSGTLDEDEDLEHDNYFVATRILIWQLLHNLSTRTNGIDVVVMVTPSVSESRIARLKKDGAIIYPVELLQADSPWVKPETHRWDDVMTKLRVWEMTQYSRILVMDSDSMLLHQMDGVFDDLGAQIQTTKEIEDYKPLEGEAPLPPTYLMASLSEIDNSNHEFPPTKTTGIKTPGYLNAGFFLLAPSLAVFDYYRSLLNIPDAFDPKYPEQNLLNKAHSWEGPMPWTELSYTWNIRCPSENDFEKGLMSVHEKFWDQPFIFGNDKVKDWLRSRRWEMKGWYAAYDLLYSQVHI